MKSKLRLRFLIFLFLSMVNFLPGKGYAQLLKSVIYDFDGLDIGQTNLPENDYHTNDLQYKVAANPLTASDMLGDRVLQVNLNWNKGFGSFVRGYLRFIEFNPTEDEFNFYFYNPSSNNQSANIDILLADDDDKSNTYNINSDDLWKKNVIIPAGGGWQLISIPLDEFTDSNPGGNGIFDMAFSQNKGMLLQLEIRFNKSNSSSNPTFYMDMISFSDESLPIGGTAFDLPPKNPNDYCLLGAYTSENKGESYLTPTHIESLFPQDPNKHLKYVNSFLQFATDGSTTPKNLPGNEVKTLLDNGYTPIITWEPMFKPFSRLDPVQPRLSNIINGDYNSYFDAFADKLKSFNDTVIIRLMHEFDGNWYSWSITENNQDPNQYITAWRKIVDRFRARGATKVKWMWCINANYAPYKYYNWSVMAYPGDNYVDIVATDVYNNHFPTDLPWWFSFRYKAVESYYYLTKYFPNKPLYICEEGCRERYASELSTSQTKAQWIPWMDKEMQSNFHRARALISFSTFNVYNWKINSSTAAQNSYETNIWNDDYYFKKPQNTTLSVSVTSPLNNSTISGCSGILIKANASGGNAPISKVEFYAGTLKLGEDLTSPYSFTWNNAATGNYQIKAVVTNNNNIKATSQIVNIIVATCCTASGTILREVWNNISGSSVNMIPIGTRPSTSGQLSIFEAPGNYGDNYGQRIRGYICPPETGNYIFWIASDDNSELSLSTDDTPSAKMKIASVSGYTNSREWDKYPSQKSVAIHLDAGKKYYIEVLHKDAIQSDNLAVGWQLPSGLQERPIPGSRLSPYSTTGVSAPVVTITSPANNFTHSTPANITIKADASSSTATITKVEFYQGATKIGEDLTAPYSFTWMNVTAGNYALKAIATDNNNLTGISPIVNIIVNTCSTPVITAGGPTTICSGAVLLKANTGTGFSYQWKKDGTDISGATASTYTTTTPGDYQVKIIQGSCISWSSPTTVKIQSGLSASITPGGPTTFCNGRNVKLYANTCSGYTYQWGKNNADIPGANAATYTATSSGNYQVRVTQAGVNAWSSQLTITVNSCRESEDTLSNNFDPPLAFSEASDSLGSFQMKVFPNPNNGLFTIEVNMPALKEEKVKLKIVNVLGQEVYNKEFIATTDYIKETVELDNSLKTGIYTLQLMIGNKTENTSIVLSK